MLPARLQFLITMIACATIIPLARPGTGHAGLVSARPPRLLDHVRAGLRARHYSRRTEKAYVGWIRRFILFHGKRHPEEVGGAEVGAYLSNLASEAKVSASTQNQALAALLLLYQQVLGRELEWLGDLSEVPESHPGPLDRTAPAAGHPDQVLPRRLHVAARVALADTQEPEKDVRPVARVGRTHVARFRP
jgi:hypothetical protein